MSCDEIFYESDTRVIISNVQQVGMALVMKCLAAARSLPPSNVQGGAKTCETHGQVHQHGLPCSHVYSQSHVTCLAWDV